MKRLFKKGFCRKAAALTLSAALALGLCACGKGGSNGENGNNSGNSASGDKTNSSMAKEYVYGIQEIAMPQLTDNENSYINTLATFYRDDVISMVLGVEDYSGDVNQTKLYLMTMKKDGTDSQVIPLQGSDTSDAEDAKASGTAAQAVVAKDTAIAESAAVETASAVDADFAVDTGADAGTDNGEEDMGSSTWEAVSYGNFAMTTENKLAGLRYYSFEDYSDPEGIYTSETRTYLCFWELDGTLLWEKELEGLRDDSSEEWLYVNQVWTDKDGGVKLIIIGNQVYQLSVSKDGEIASEKQPFPEETSTILMNATTFVKQDGTLVVSYSDESDWSVNYMNTYDPETDTFGTPVETPASLSWMGYSNMTGGADCDLIFSTTDGIYSYNMGDTEITKRMDFVNSDVDVSNFTGLVQVDATHIIGMYVSDYDYSKVKAAVFTYKDPADIPDKAVIVIAGNYLNNDIRRRVVEYNRSSDTYRLVIKDYDSYNSYDDYSAGTTKLNNDIITGSMPDILVSDGLPVENYISKGLIADIGELIAQDEELSQTEFMQNVFDAYSVDGKLYYVVPSFYTCTMLAKTSLVGDGSNWNMEALKQVLASMGENTQAIGGTTRADFMNLAMQYCGNDFIDVSTGKCSFDSDNFIAMMEFAKTFPEEIDWDSLYADENYWKNSDGQYREEKTLLLSLSFSDIANLNYYMNGIFGEEVTFVGFPTESGKGSYVSSADETFVLSAKSKNLDGAWDFVRYYLTEDYQKDVYGLPVDKSIFMERAAEAMKNPTYVDENGQEVEYQQTYWIGEEDVELQPLTQEQVNQVVSFVESVDRAYYSNSDVMNIINEEMDAFYSGQKTARDVAAIIQSRAQIYVDENR